MNKGLSIGLVVLAIIIVAYEVSQRSDPFIEDHTYVEQKDLLGISHSRDLGTFHFVGKIESRHLEGIVLSGEVFYLPITRNGMDDSLQGAAFLLEDSSGKLYSCLLLTEKTKASISREISASEGAFTSEYVTVPPPIGKSVRFDAVFVGQQRMSVPELIDRFYEGDIEAATDDRVRVDAVILSTGAGD